MEHRYSERVTANIKVLIYRDGLPAAIGRLRNINRTGLFVQCSVLNFAIYRPLDIELLMHGRARVGDFRFRCYLIHSSGVGLGLEMAGDVSMSRSFTDLHCAVDHIRNMYALPPSAPSLSISNSSPGNSDLYRHLVAGDKLRFA